ncbi:MULTISPECIES: hypothetical protein [unclassified Halomonas]|uniref:hypothetical protein n=1 Tax=unclassified Halomonas TaxID=2609666 RepID=UPI0009907123|nr:MULTISPECIES: hypothetical protein [unclassified Halomonas]AQU81872.1 hypothetical protein B2G49_04220 [Halomonas sp. 'Soap Lake \
MPTQLMPTLLKTLEWRVKRLLGYQEANIRAEIEQSGYFHSEWYLANYPELLNQPSAVKDPLGYYLVHGIQQGHNPGPGFHTLWYLEEYDDVRSASINPLLHYLRFGREEDRRPTPFLGGVQSMLHNQGSANNHRVIYKTRRSADLSHLGRIKRLDHIEGVQIWREFSHTFREQQGNLAQQEAEYLHNRGFLPNRKRLYKLPDTRVDAYISDLQASLLAQTNGPMQPLLENAELQWQLYNQRIPMVANPTVTKQALPTGPVLKVILIMDPAGAGLVPLSVVATKKATAATVGMALSMQLSPNSGRTRSVARFNASGIVVGPRKPVPWEKYRYKAIWQQANASIVVPIQKESLYSFIQMDIDISTPTPKLIRLAATPTVEDFQVHGPLMQNQTAIDFMREFGI